MDSATQAAPVVQPVKQKAGNNYLLYVVGLVIILVVIVGGIFAYKSFLSPEAAEKAKSATQTNYPALDSLERELGGLNIETVDADFTELDKDLNSL